jgi:hypothetical protein
MAQINMTANDNGETGALTIDQLLENIVGNVDTIRNNMKGGGLGVKSVDSFGNSTDGTFQSGDLKDDNLAALATASEKLPEYKGRLINALVTERGGLGLATTSTTLDGLIRAVEDIALSKHTCEDLATATDDYGKYIPLNLGGVITISPGYHTGGMRIIAVDDDECENEAHLNIGATRYTAPLPGDASLVINNDAVNRIDADGNYVYDSPNHIEQKGYYGLTTVTIDPPDLQDIAGSRTLATEDYVVSGTWFVGAEGLTEGALEFDTCTIASSDLPAPGSAVKIVSAPDDIAYKEVKISPIPDYYLNTSGGGTPVVGTVKLSEMTGNVTFLMDQPKYVKSIKVDVIIDDIYNTLKGI